MRLSLSPLLILLFASTLNAAELRLTVVDEDGSTVWARVEVRGPDGQMRQPADAIRDRSATNRAVGEPWYVGGFLAQGPQTLELPAGDYRVVAERGPEYRRFDETVTVGDEPVERQIQLERWIDMNALGFYSGDFHIHRPLYDAEAILLAENLNYGAFLTIWNKSSAWEQRPWPKNPVVRVDDQHIYSILNAEDERGGGAWTMHMLHEPIDLQSAERWSPPGVEIIQKAQQQRYVPTGFPWIDLEKPFWLEAPVVMALATPDSIGLLHNHFNQYGILANEAWGRARDEERFPGREGFVEASLEINYRFWNLGFEVPASAGSASGVLPNPAGYNRIYVEIPEPFDVEPFYRNLRQGRSFVTNGPMLFFNVTELPGRRIGVTLDVRSREPLTKVELIANGVVVETFSAPPGKTEFQTEISLREGLYTWVAARAFSENDATIRMAHTQPVRLVGHWPAQDDAAFFVEWIDELIADAQDDSERFSSDTEREKAIGLYDQARSFYQNLQ